MSTEDDKSRRMRPFSGSSGSDELFDDWAQKLEDWIEQLQVTTEPAKLAKLKWMLEGPARKYFDTLSGTQCDTLKHALGSLRARFQNDWTAELAKERLAICRQLQNESISVFAERLKKAVRAAHPGVSESELDKHTFAAFKNQCLPPFALYIRTKSCNDMLEAEKLTTEIEAYVLSQTMRDPNWQSAGSDLAAQMSSLKPFETSYVQSNDSYNCDKYRRSDREKYRYDDRNNYRHDDRESYRHDDRENYRRHDRDNYRNDEHESYRHRDRRSIDRRDLSPQAHDYRDYRSERDYQSDRDYRSDREYRSKEHRSRDDDDFVVPSVQIERSNGSGISHQQENVTETRNYRESRKHHDSERGRM